MSRVTTKHKHQDNHMNTSNNTSDIIAPKPSLTDDKNRSELDAVTEEVKQDLRGLFGKTGKLIEKLGNAIKKVVKKEESICEEIKIRLKEEIAEGIISTRTIERHCPKKWKKNTKPKNDNLSFSKTSEQRPQQQIAATQDGKSVIISEASSITRASDDVNQIHDQSNQCGISDDNNEAQTTVTNQGELVSYNEPKDNTVGDSASSDVVQKLQPHQEYSQHDQKEIKQLQRQLYECKQELVDKVSQIAKLSDELRHFKELQTLQKDDVSDDAIQKLVSHPSDKQIEGLEAQTLKRRSMQMTDEIPVNGFTISKEKYGMVTDAMDNSKASIVVKFDQNKNFLGADPDVAFDISGANHQDGNVQQIQSDDVAFTETRETRG